MYESTLGALAAALVFLLLLSGMPVALALGVVSLLFLLTFNGLESLPVLVSGLFGGLNEFALLSIPMFVLMGTAIAASRAGKELYEALEQGLDLVPGGLLVSNLGAGGLFAWLTASYRDTSVTIGEVGIPRMCRQGYPVALAAGCVAAGGTLTILIPPSITMIVYAIATGTSVGSLFLAGVLPGMLLLGLFMAWAWLHAWRTGYRFAGLRRVRSSSDKLIFPAKVFPFLILTGLILWALNARVATAPEAASLGALIAIVLVIGMYRIRGPEKLWRILRTATRESVTIMLIIATAALFSDTMSTLQINQGIAEWILGLELNRWWLLLGTAASLLLAGVFLPPVAVVVIATPVLVPIMSAAGFDPLWFGVVLTAILGIGLLTPPLGANLGAVASIVPDVRPTNVFRGTVPFVVCTALAILLLVTFPQIALWLPNTLSDPGI